MGIDVYMHWKGQTEKEREQQLACSFRNIGYLREAYHGGPYVTRFLVWEAFLYHPEAVKIRAAVLRRRLPEAIKLAIERARVVYGEKIDENHPYVKSFVDFVELAERKEAETGEPVEIEVLY